MGKFAEVSWSFPFSVNILSVNIYILSEDFHFAMHFTSWSLKDFQSIRLSLTSLWVKLFRWNYLRNLFGKPICETYLGKQIWVKQFVNA